MAEIADVCGLHVRTVRRLARRAAARRRQARRQQPHPRLPGAAGAERAAVERHPRYTWDVLSRVRAFADFAWTAATHHEKLDGSGYPWGLTGEVLDLPARILAVADIYEALIADRPYRAGMSPGGALAIIARDRGAKLCPVAIDALEVWVTGTADERAARAA